MQATATIAKWQNNAKAAFALYYDDGCFSTLKTAVPCLRKYDIPGTFYLCTGWYKDKPAELDNWLAQVDEKIVFIGNHTVAHCGVQSYENAKEELCNNDAVLREKLGYSPKKMLSYGRPGGCCWKITDEEEKEILDSIHTIRREHEKADGSEYAGALSVKTFEDARNALDAIEATGNNDYIVFHGIGGDWFNFPAADHEKLVQELAIRKAKHSLWVAASIDIHKYIVERNNASITTLPLENDDEIMLKLSVTTDPESFNTPLTVVVEAPTDWVRATITQGDASYIVPVFDGKVTFDAAPITGSISITKC